MRRTIPCLALVLALCACVTADGPPVAPAARADDGCRPQPGRPVLVEVSPGVNTVRGPLAGFDPCDPSVDIRLPPGDTAPALMILVHGGGGAASDNTRAAALFHEGGMAVLNFDAYRMNGFDRDARFWVNQASYEARQRMIRTTALAAYRWAVEQPRFDRSRIFVYGLSNGADVVANMAAEVDPAHVRMVFAEGLAGAGLGLPDRLRVPLRAIFGRLDNYAGRTEDDLRWRREVPCALNLPDFDGPPGNAADCNARRNPGARTQSPEAWIAARRAGGADVEAWFYEGGAHGMLTGSPLTRRTNRWGKGTVLHANVGAEPETRARLVADVLAEVRGRR
jgi:dienelactone hydrolase